MAHIPRLYLPGRLGPGPLTLDAAQSRRLASVIRLREGDSFLAFSGDGREWRSRITALTKASLRAEVEELTRQEAALPIVVDVWLALIRPQRFDLAIEKCTEAGADIIRPMLTDHLARGEGASAQRHERWERIAIEAAEQCGRLRVPVIGPPASFADLVGRHRGALLVGDQQGRPWPDAAALLPEKGDVAIAIGPEGGFSPDELARATARGAIAACFGPNILRAETAAVVATALVRSLGR